MRELTDGVTTAFVLLASMLTLGLIAFGPVGTLAVEAGVRAAFAAAIFGNLTAAFLATPLLPNEVPRASTVFVFAAFITRLVADPRIATSLSAGVHEVLFLAASCLLLSGLIQMAFGLLRLGNIARFVPYPVVAGLMSGLAIALVFYELPEILGTHASVSHDGTEAAHTIFNPWTVMLTLATIGVVVLVAVRWPRAPSKLIGVAAGTALAVLVSRLVPDAELGQRVPDLGRILPTPDALARLFSPDGLALLWHFRLEILLTAATIAIVGSLDSLLPTVGEGAGPLENADQPNRLLVAVGLGNVVCGLFGGVPVAYSSRHSFSAHRASPLKALSSIATSVTLLVLLLYGAPLLHMIPVAVLSGIMVVIALGLINRWAGSTLQRARRRQVDRELVLNVLLVLTVAAVTVAFGLVHAVVVGTILSMALFIAVMNRSLVRSVTNGQTRASRRVYPEAQLALLRTEGHRVRVMEVDGAIFFGTADRLGAEAMRVAEGAAFLVLDLRRVTMIDASGALMLARLSVRLADDGVRLLLGHVSESSTLGRALQGAAVFTQKRHQDWFADTDRALEFAERQLLAEAKMHEPRHELALADFKLFAGLGTDERDFLKPYLDRQLFPAGAVLFREGHVGQRLYLLARGAVSIVADDPDAPSRRRRVCTFAPGVMFGETAMLEQARAAATAVAEVESATYSLSRANLEAIREADPELYERLLLNVLAHMSGLLRLTAGVVRESSDAAD